MLKISLNSVSTQPNDSPTIVHFSHRELPLLGISFAILKCRDSSTFSFSVIVDKKGIANLHFMERIDGPPKGQVFCQCFF